jgi:hypothetical protein
MRVQGIATTARKGAVKNVIANAVKNVIANAVKNVIANAVKNVIASAAKNVIASVAKNVIASVAKQPHSPFPFPKRSIVGACFGRASLAMTAYLSSMTFFAALLAMTALLVAFVPLCFRAYY